MSITTDGQQKKAKHPSSAGVMWVENKPETQREGRRCYYVMVDRGIGREGNGEPVHEWGSVTKQTAPSKNTFPVF